MTFPLDGPQNDVRTSVRHVPFARTKLFRGLVGIVAAGFLTSLASADLQAAVSTPVGRFIVSLDGDGTVSPQAAKWIRETWSQCQDCDAEEFLTQGLAVLSGEFRSGLDAYDADQYGTCTEFMGKLSSDPNPFVAIHAAVYKIKALVANDQLLDAGLQIEQLITRHADRIATHSYFAAEVAFLRGYCLLSDLRYREATRVLSGFLQAYPDASQRLVLAARQMVAELEHRQPGRIGEVVDLMGYAGRRLTQGDTGETVQTRQQRVIEILDRMIKDAEDKEKSSSSSSSGGGGGSGGSKSQSQQKPMQDSTLPGGSAQEGALQSSRRANPGDAWGSMPPAERQRILQALRESFPARYRQLVEQYYEQLAKKP